MHKLNCSVQKYDWGRIGYESKVSIYKKSQESTFEVNEHQAYAELWMGTHKNGPSKLCDEAGTTLSDYLVAQADLAIGKTISNHFYQSNNEDNLNYGDLPFLFKVLSINKVFFQ
jgi:mannose-6-phosphate isomerase